MKDTIITVRLPKATRRRLELLARREQRSLSQQVERLIEQGLATHPVPVVHGPRPLSGRLRIARAPSLADFRKVRTQLSASFERRLTKHGERRR